MTGFVALLRAVNVGGTGKLAMSDLKALCESLGFGDVQTYIASGNVVFTTDMGEREIKRALGTALEVHVGKRIDVFVRTGREMASILAENPFPDAQPKWTVAIFLDRPPSADALDTIRGQDDEEVALGRREIYVRYGKGMGKSKLRIPTAETGTARNMNTIARLAAMTDSR